MHFVPSFCPLTALHSHYSGRKSDTEPRPWRPLPLDLIYIETNHGCLHSGSCCPNTCAAVATSPSGCQVWPPCGLPGSHHHHAHNHKRSRCAYVSTRLRQQISLPSRASHALLFPGAWFPLLSSAKEECSGPRPHTMKHWEQQAMCQLLHGC